MPVVSADQFVSLHTATGVQLFQFTPDQYTEVSWTRRQRDASQCDVQIPPEFDFDRLPELVAWAHWLSVWDGSTDQLMWTGPIQKARENRTGLTINAKDHAAYLTKTRNPITKRWDAADPADIAGELWMAMIATHGLNARPIVRPDPEGDRFDFQVIADETELDQTVSDLVNLGLRWSVVSGVPIVGPWGYDPVASLGEGDFIGEGIDLVRDGSATVNDVLVRGPENLARARVEYYGQNLQSIADVDSMFGVSNVAKAARQFVRNTGTARTRLELPAGTQLHPDAPVSIDDLMTSARFVIESRGIRELMELTEVNVTRRSGAAAVSVTMKALPDRDTEGHLIELADVETQRQPVVTLGGQAAQ